MKSGILRLVLFVIPTFLGCSILAQETEPQALITARDIFTRDFVQELSVIQNKYTVALLQYQRKFTTSGDLISAKEAELELRMANEWVTIPPCSRSNEPTNADLKALVANYDAAAGAVVGIVMARYLEKLDYLKKGFASRNNLKALEQAGKAVNAAEAKHGLPRSEGAKSYLSSLNQEGFHEWLKRQKFRFAGTSAGVTNVWLGDDQLQYHPVDQELPKAYSYKIKGNRSVDIGDGYFEMIFSKDLQSASFKSGRGEYPLEINPDN